jgi:multiple sugar transport system permease protein
MTNSEHWDRVLDTLWSAFRVLIITISLLITIIPFLYLFINSVKLPMEFLTVPPTILPSQVTLEHYQAIFSAESSETSRNLANSLIITTATTIIAVLIGSLAAYSLARLDLPYRLASIIAFAFLVVRFYPKITTTLPYFMLMRNFGLLDTRIAIIIAHVSITLPFVVWLMLTFFEELPKELEQAAMLDGCNPWQRLTKIVLPLTAPGLFTAAILTALVSWNEFLIASSLASIKAKTLPIAVASFITDKGILWGPMSAMSTVIVVPIMLFALFTQRYLVRGLTLGAVKE